VIQRIEYSIQTKGNDLKITYPWFLRNALTQDIAEGVWLRGKEFLRQYLCEDKKYHLDKEIFLI